jgi:hypothetical protein
VPENRPAGSEAHNLFRNDLRKREGAMGRRVGILVLVFLVLAPSARATNFDPPYNEGRIQNYLYDALTSEFSGATNWTRNNNLDPTRINTYGTGTHSNAHVHVQDAVYDQTWVGWAPCMNQSGSLCFHWHVYYNWKYYYAVDTIKERRSLACEETGHTVGLEHDYSGRTTCMGAGDHEYFSGHDINHINARY